MGSLVPISVRWHCFWCATGGRARITVEAYREQILQEVLEEHAFAVVLRDGPPCPGPIDVVADFGCGEITYRLDDLPGPGRLEFLR